MREDQIDQAERRATLADDLKVLQERGSTYHQHGLAQADEVNQGRFRATGTPHVVGSAPAALYPAASAHQRDPVPDEPSLGFSIDQLTDPEQVLSTPEPSSLPCAARDPGPASTAGAPSLSASGDVLRAGDVGPSSSDQQNKE